MYSTIAYLYQQITRVLLIDTSGGYSTMRYNPVYAKPLSVAKGVDNVLLFEFVNQDQKPVNITGSTFVFRIIAQNGEALLLSKDMVILSAALGRIKVTLTSADLDQFRAQPASYSISKTSGGLTTAVFTDAAAGARAPLQIEDSVQPEFIPSIELTVPTTQYSARVTYDGTSGAQYPDWALQSYGSNSQFSPYQTQEYFSSHFTPNSSLTTVQMELVNYTGTIKAQGATDYQGIWYNVTDSTTYLNETGTIHLNILGWHPLLRIGFNNSIYSTTEPPGRPATATVTVVDGVLTGISLTNAGSGYLAAPRVDVIGDGSGAIISATVAGGQISGFNIVSGGTGYRPNPATGVAALVNINTGFVTNIVYR